MTVTIEERLARLSPQQRALLARRLARPSVDATSIIPLQPRDGRRFPLSFAQERLWFEHQLDAFSPTYNEPVVLKIAGPLRLDWLHEALNARIAAHESLRTGIVTIEGKPNLAISPELSVPLPVIDLKGQSEAAIESAIREEIRRPFTLHMPPLLRMTVFQTGDLDHIILFVMHHIISDGWSAAILFRELFAAYEARQRDEEPDVRKPSVQYADFAVYERERFERGDLDGERDFWVATLADAPPPPALPLDRPRPALRTSAGGRVGLRCDAVLTAQVQALAKRHGTTLFATLAAAYAVLLARASGTDEIVISVPSTTRDLPELETAIGLFINTLILRLPVDPAQPFSTLLADVSRRATEARAHQQYPYDRLVDHLRRTRDLGPVPMTNLMFDVQRLPASIAPAGLSVAYLEIDTGTSKFDLGLSVKDDGGELIGMFEYASDLFDRATIDSIAEQFLALIGEIVARPNAPVGDLKSMSAETTAAALAAGHGPAIALPAERRLHMKFGDIVASMPGETAVTCGTESLTFAELERRANQLAHRLVSSGVTPARAVALRLPRSVELIVGILGILKSGAAYVPLEATWPLARQINIIVDSNATAIVTDGALEGLPARVASIDIRTIGEEPVTQPDVASSADDPAYILYTSGSTGAPRGVIVPHRAAMNLLHALKTTIYASLGARLNVSVNGPVVFDTSVKQIVQLLAGHRLVIIPEDLRADPAALVRMLRQSRIDVLDITPTQLAMLIAEGLLTSGQTCPKAVLVGGEPIDAALWAKLAATPVTRFYNLYGPTETTVDATFAAVSGAAPTIGHALPNVRTYVLDAEMRPVPLGMPGELYIGGAGVALGYLGNADLTAARFVTLPFDPKPVYRTGDRVRRRTDGSLQFLGRADDQLKLRGYRIEPGEIVGALKGIAGVVDAAVVAHGEGAHQRLVAYVVPEPTRGPRFEGKSRRTLPNGLAVVELNRNETDFLYEEMFELEAYFRHGVELRPGDTVFDVGANIGLFTLAAHLAAPDVKLHSFEPNPTVFALLKANAALYGVATTLHNIGLAAAPGSGAFTFYPGFSILSGLAADFDAEAEVVRSFVRKHEDTSSTGFEPDMLEELLEDRLAAETFDVALDTLSDVIAREGISHIDLLKINVEKAEAEVLAGIRDADWARINQVALELHDIDGRLAAVTALLEGHGFKVTIQQDWRLESSTKTNYYLYAQRGTRDGERPLRGAIPPVMTPDMLRAELAQCLPDYMIPSDIVFLDHLPTTVNGKLDRRALPAPSGNPAKTRVAPRNTTEAKLARLWSDVLRRDEIGIHDDFFRLGGHSLLATMLMAQLRTEFNVALPLRTLFEAPTVAQLAERIDAETRTHPESVAPIASLPDIVPDPARWYEPFPLTPIQEAYWMGRTATFELGQAATQIYLELEQSGWELPRLEAVWNQLVKRHDMLRAVILSEEHQQVLPEVPYYTIPFDDLRGRPVDDLARHLEWVRAAMQGRSLPSDRWPLFQIRATIMDDKLRLHIGVDALIADAASLFLLFDEWRQGYERGYEPPPLGLGFRDYVLAERALHSGALYQASRDYWLDRIATLPPTPDLPVDRALAASIAKPDFVRRQRRLSPEAWIALKARAARHGLTPSLVLIAAYAEVLGNWSASARFTLNLTTFNRLPLHPDVAGLMGDFTTLTLLEADHSEASSFLARARALQSRLWDDLEHRFISGIDVLRMLAQKRRSGTTALMPVVFTSALDIDTAGHKVGRFGDMIESVSQTPQVWLDHQVMEWNGALILNWDAVEAIFPAGMLDDLALAHGDLVARLAASDDAWEIWHGSLAPRAQLDQRAAINATATDFPVARLESGFLASAAAKPEAPAVITSRRILTYGELLARAGEIADLLRARSEGPGKLVAVVMRKDWEQIAAALGILMAGAAYLPFDPDLPAERRQYLLEHCDVTTILTQSSVSREIDWPAGVARIAVDHLAGLADPSAAVGHPVTDDSLSDLAYVLFTSGSTGLPKGVMISQRAIANSIADFTRRYEFGPSDRTIGLSAQWFDLSVFDIFCALSSGGAIVLPDHDKLRDPTHWAELAVKHRVTVWQSVPVLMQMLVEALEPRRDLWPASLRSVVMSGDWIPVTLPDRIRAFDRSIEVHGQGGATETSINAVVYEIGAVDPAWHSIPYGNPFANQTAHILNGLLEPVPIWVPGELYIGGTGLADGYWKDAAKTEAAFIRHPRSAERLYRTGDYGRFLPDGTIEFLGRRDNQVKVNGHRVELGEIEAALAQHPGISSAVATAPADALGHRRLIAYVVPHKAPNDAEEPGTELDTSGMLTDPIGRVTFKLNRHGLRAASPEAAAIALPSAGFDASRRAEWLQRQSFRRFDGDRISVSGLANLLGALQEMPVDGSPLPKFRYPSAGSLYPVQVYVVVKPDQIAGIDGGAYYYDPRGHRLVSVGRGADMAKHYPGPNRPLVNASSFSLILVGRRAAVEPMYGPLWRDFCLLEAGYIGQLLTMAAPSQHIGLCALGFVADAPVHDILCLDAADVVLHSLAGGPIGAAQLDVWAPEEVPQSGVSPQDLRAFLRRKLPDYMLPARFVLLDELPLNANGKVNRDALPDPDASASVAVGPGTAPVSDIEKRIAAVVESLLQNSQLGLDSNFFDLGANSVHLVQIHRRLQEDLARTFPLVDLFQNPSIRSLARFLDGGAEELATDDIIARVERSRDQRSKRLARRRTAGSDTVAEPEASS